MAKSIVTVAATASKAANPRDRLSIERANREARVRATARNTIASVVGDAADLPLRQFQIDQLSAASVQALDPMNRSICTFFLVCPIDGKRRHVSSDHLRHEPLPLRRACRGADH
jgi:hypothetical protein